MPLHAKSKRMLAALDGLEGDPLLGRELDAQVAGLVYEASTFPPNAGGGGCGNLLDTSDTGTADTTGDTGVPGP